MSNEQLLSVNQDAQPYIDFVRTENEHLGEDKGEAHDVKWRCFLADMRGNVYVWARLSQISRYARKGWKIVGYGNFNKMAKPDDLIGRAKVEELESFVRPMAEANAELVKLKGAAAKVGKA